MSIKSIGLPSIRKNKYKSEKRAFMPSFVEMLKKYEVDVYLDEDYGSKMGYTFDDYKSLNDKVKVASHRKVYEQDLVIILKAPKIEELDLMNKNSILISMLHYDSEPVLLEKIKENQIMSFSMDSVVDDFGDRLIVTYEQTALGGVRIAINEMEKRRKDFYSEKRNPYKIVIFGMGNLGINAGKYCFKCLSKKINKQGNKEIQGAVINYLNSGSIKNKNEIRRLFATTDLLIDATKRIDFSKYIITNDLIGCLKEEAIILDLTADPYYENANPVQVKAFEGLPYGTLDKYVFEIDDSKYDEIPKMVRTDFRRVTISCNGWPGVFPKESMKVYEKQLEPFLNILLKSKHNISEISSNPYERALYKSTTEYFEKTKA